MYPAWERYVKLGKIEYKNLHEIDSKSLFKEQMNIPESIPLAAALIGLRSSLKGDEQIADAFSVKMNSELKSRGYENFEELKKLSAGEILKLTIDIVGKSMRYQDVHYKDMILEGNPNHFDCFVEGCGVCADYARMMVEVFNWFRAFNKNIENVFVIYTAGKLHNGLTPHQQESLVNNGKYDGDEGHAWNILLILSPEKITYSHFDVTAAYEGEYGSFWEGQIGYHRSKNENLNLAALLESLKELKPSYEMYVKQYFVQNHISPPSKSERILQLYKLIELSFDLGRYDQVCGYYNELVPMIKNNSTFKLYQAKICSKIQQESHPTVIQ